MGIRRIACKAAWIALMCLVCQFCFAGVTFTPHPGYPSPNFFSGTNARAFYHASLTFPNFHISQVQLIANDQVMAIHSFTPTGSPPRTAYRIQDWIGVMFDSSMFEHGADVTIKCKVLVDGTTWYEDSYTAPSINKAFLAGLDGLEQVGSYSSAASSRQGTLAAQTVLLPYFQVFRDVSQWDAGTYNLGLIGKNIHVYAGHSTTTYLLDGQHTSPFDPVHGYDGTAVFFRNQEDPNISNVEDNRTANMSGALPPFSPGPSFNLAVMESCQVGKDSGNSWIYMFPFWNGYGKYKENQAVLGCTAFLLLDAYRNISEQLFGPLVTGHTISKARDDMVQFFIDNQIVAVSQDNVTDTVPSFDDFKIKGDASATIRKVYDPNETVQSTQFWRQIAENTLISKGNEHALHDASVSKTRNGPT